MVQYNQLKIRIMAFVLMLTTIFSTAFAQQDSIPNYPIDTIKGQVVYRYVVEKGEGLYRISKKFNVKQEEIIKLNPSIEREGLKLDQTIYVPVRKIITAEPIDTTKYIYHVIEPKETLYGLSRKYGVPMRQIEQLNPLIVPNMPYGATLRIPRTDKNSDKTISKVSDKTAEKTNEKSIGKQQDKTVGLPQTLLDEKPIVNNESVSEEPKKTIAKKEDASPIDLGQKDLESQSPTTQPAELPISQPLLPPTVEPVQAEQNPVAEEPIEELQNTYIDTTLLNIPYTDGFPTDFLNLGDSAELIPMRVAYLLPLMLNASKRDANIDRFLEFYEGSLLAINDLQRQGLRIETYAYDIERNDITLQTILQRPELRTLDAIIGPAYPAQVEQVAQLAKQERIPLVVPFTSNIQALDTNEYILRFNLSPDHEAQTMVQYLVEHKADMQIVVVETETSEEAEVSQLVIENLKKQHLSVANAKIGNLKSALKKGKENVLIFKNLKLSDVSTYFTELTSLAWDYQVSLVGQYNWVKSQIPFTTYYVSVFDADDTVKEDIYVEEFNQYFNYPLSNSKPRYDMLGYDITVYTFRMLYESQVKNTDNRSLQEIIPQIDYQGVQSDIKFVRLGLGGFANRGHVVVRKAEK